MEKTMKIRPDLSFCLLHVDPRDRALAGFLEALEMHAGAVDYEVIVATDQAEHQALAAIEREFPQIIILETNITGQPVQARNHALRLAQGRYLACWDENIPVRPGTLASLLAFLEETPEAGLAAPRIVAPDGKVLPSVRTLPSLATLLFLHTPLGRLLPAAARTIERHLLSGQDHLQSFAGEWLLESCLLIRREVVEEIGLFDEGFTRLYCDADYCLRARRAGWHLHYRAGTVLVHDRPETCLVRCHRPGANPPHTAGDCTRFLLKKWLQPALVPG